MELPQKRTCSRARHILHRDGDGGRKASKIGGSQVVPDGNAGADAEAGLAVGIEFDWLTERGFAKDDEVAEWRIIGLGSG